MQELLECRFAPVTDTVGFLECDASTAVRGFLEWQEPIQSQRGVSFERRQIGHGLSEALTGLLPLTSVERRRFLFIPTRSRWTAFFDNGHDGTDALAHVSHLARTLSCRAIRATYLAEGREAFPATILELFGAEMREFLNYIRSVSVSYDGRKWAFSATGEVQPYEQVDRYSARLVKHRFDGEMLNAYLYQIGIEMFDEHFYLPTGDGAALLQKRGPMAPNAREMPLKAR